MAFYGAIPLFVPALVPGESVLIPVPLELQTPAELSTLAAQHFNIVSLCSAAKVGSIFPVMELRDLFPAIIPALATNGNPPVLGVPAEEGPVPISFCNYRIPIGAYQLLSANALLVTCGLVLNLYGAVNQPARCSLLPAGVDVLPKIITLPAQHAHSLFMMSAEGMRWMDLNSLYDPLFAAIYANNIPVYTIPPFLNPIVSNAANNMSSASASSLVKQGEQNPAFPLGTPVYSATQDRQSNIWTNSRPIYVLNNCDRDMAEQLCGSRDPLSKISKENLRRRVAVDFHTCAFYQIDNFDHHVTQNFAQLIEESPPKSGKYNIAHLRMYLPRASLTDPLPKVESIEQLVLAINNWRSVTCQTLTPAKENDVLFFSRMVLSMTTTLSDPVVGGIGKITSIDALVDFVSKLFEKMALLLRVKEYTNPVVSRELLMMFPQEISKLFNFDQERNLAEAAFIERTKTQINLQFPINKSLDTLEKEKRSASKRSYDEKGNDSNNNSGSGGSPGANLERNRAKRSRQKENKKKAADGSPKPDKSKKTRHCINHFAEQLKASSGFANGMPKDAKVRGCHPSNGVCTFTHSVVDQTPGSLNKGIADELIKATENFGNSSFKSNFIRIVKFLRAT